MEVCRGLARLWAAEAVARVVGCILVASMNPPRIDCPTLAFAPGVEQFVTPGVSQPASDIMSDHWQRRSSKWLADLGPASTSD